MLDFRSYWMEDMRLNTHAPSHWLPVPHHNRKVLPDQFPSDQERLPAALLLSLHQVLNMVCHVFLPRHYRLQLLSELLPLPVPFWFPYPVLRCLLPVPVLHCQKSFCLCQNFPYRKHSHLTYRNSLNFLCCLLYFFPNHRFPEQNCRLLSVHHRQYPHFHLHLSVYSVPVPQSLYPYYLSGMQMQASQGIYS